MPIVSDMTPAMQDFLMGVSGIVCAFLIVYALLNASR